MSETQAAISTLILPRSSTSFDAPRVRLCPWQGMACPTHVAYPSQMPICRIFVVKSGKPKVKPYSYNDFLPNTLHFTMIPLQNPRHRLRLDRQQHLLLPLLLPYLVGIFTWPPITFSMECSFFKSSYCVGNLSGDKHLDLTKCLYTFRRTPCSSLPLAGHGMPDSRSLPMPNAYL